MPEKPIAIDRKAVWRFKGGGARQMHEKMRQFQINVNPFRQGGGTMPTYITLVNFTQKGIENIKESPARLDTIALSKIDTGMLS